jgi:hypothetical protein
MKPKKSKSKTRGPISTREDLAAKAKRLQQEFESAPPLMIKKDMAKLLSLLRQLGQAFFESTNSISRAEFKKAIKNLRKKK